MNVDSENDTQSGLAQIDIATIGAIQKDLVDGLEEEDFEEMGVTKKEVLAELEYKDVLIPLESQYNDIEIRKQKSRKKIELSWGEDWKDILEGITPDWESEHYLQHLSVLAIEFPHILFGQIERVNGSIPKEGRVSWEEVQITDSRTDSRTNSHTNSRTDSRTPTHRFTHQFTPQFTY